MRRPHQNVAVIDTFKRPMAALGVMLRGVRTDGPMAPEIPLDRQRPAQFVFSSHVERKLAAIRSGKAKPEGIAAAE